MVRVGLKYCGGCSARFDRVALVSKIIKYLSHQAVFVSAYDNSADIILIVSGCESACVDATQFSGKKVFVLFREEQAGTFMEIIRQMESFHELGENL